MVRGSQEMKDEMHTQEEWRDYKGPESSWSSKNGLKESLTWTGLKWAL